MAFDAIRRESAYLLYYLSLQIRLIAPYWAIGTLVGSLVSVFAKNRIHRSLGLLGEGRLGLMGLIPASLIGIASPLCMYGTIPIAASFSENGLRDDWLAAFMVSSVLLNPQLLAYSAVLGRRMALLRLLACFLCGVIAGLIVRIAFKDRRFFSFSSSGEDGCRDDHPSPLVRLLRSLWRNIRATGPYFFLGIVLTAVYQRYVPERVVAGLFGEEARGFGVLMAAALGVPVYVCGGGTIPLLAEWLRGGMSAGGAVAFMISGPATKLTNLSAMKAVLGPGRFFLYFSYTFLFALAMGVLVNFLDWPGVNSY